MFGNDFDGNLAFVSLIDGFIDFCECSFTQYIDKGERFYFLVQQVLLFDGHLNRLIVKISFVYITFGLYFLNDFF
jgi:hypothetical protein